MANNLLDKAYPSAITENAAWLGAPRTILMTATVSSDGFVADGPPVHDCGRYWTKWYSIWSKRSRAKANTKNSGSEPVHRSACRTLAGM